MAKNRIYKIFVKKKRMKYFEKGQDNHDPTNIVNENV